MTTSTNNTVKNIRAAALETLDQRQMLSSVLFDHGNLSITGSNNNDNISVSREGASVVVTANGSVIGSRPLSKVTKITINAKNGDNRVEVSPKLAIQTIVTTGAGRDTITTGAGSDSVFSGDGDDSISTGDGNDYVNAGGGDDYVTLGRGSDSAQGGPGKDTLIAGRGTDTLRGGAHNDTLVGHNGDYLEGGGGVDFISHNGLIPNAVATAHAAVGRVSSFSIVNADTGAVVKGYESLNKNASIDLASLPARFSVRANVTGTIGSVRLEAPGTSRVENKVPYALLGDTGNAYTPWSVGTGDKTIKATTFSAANGAGAIGSSTSLTIKFVRNNPAPTPTPTPTPAPTPTPTPAPAPTSTNAGVAAIDVASVDLRAGQAVHVVGTRSTARTGGVEDLKFEWNFGDAGSKYNTLAGFNAAHVYNRAGTYTVSLKLTDPQGRTSVSSRQITVASANVQKTLYVNTSGSDSASGSEAAPLRTLERALSLASDNTTIYMRRGQTFNTSGVVINNKNFTLTAYGSGAGTAKLLYTGPRQESVIVRVNSSASNVVVSNLTFDSTFTSDTDQQGVPHAIQPAGSNITIRDNVFLNVGHAINGNMSPSNMLIQDNTAPSVTGVRAYFTWVSGTNYTIVGNTVANSTREHCIRVWGVTNLNVSSNDLTNADRRSQGDQWDFSKGTLTVQEGSYAYVANNKSDADFAFGPLGGTTGMNSKAARFNHVVVENNDISERSTVWVRHGMNHITVRNNVLHKRDGVAIDIEDFNSTYNRGTSDVSILNNLAINSGTIGSFLVVAGRSDGVELVGNTYVAPNLVYGDYGTAAVVVGQANLASFTRIANNTWPVNTNLTGYAQGGIMLVGGSFRDASGWRSYSVVSNETFRTIRLNEVVVLNDYGPLG